MFETFKNAWKIADLRKKILYTIMVIAVVRLGSVALPVPFLDPSSLQSMVNQTGSMLGYIDILTGGAFANATIFALSITPYINASIIINLLTIAIPPLERLSKEGEEGRRKLNKITRYTALGLAVALSVAYYFLLKRQGALLYTGGFAGIFSAIVIITAFTAGAMLIIWLGEQIDKKGIGNGISLIIFAGIVSRGKQLVSAIIAYFKLAAQGEWKFYIYIPLILVLAVVIIGFVVMMTEAERRVPVQYAKRVVGRKMYGGQSSFIPIKVNMSGVLPIIFASSIISIPGTIKAFFDTDASTWWGKFLSIFDYNSLAYAIIYFLLIMAFNYFYVAVQYNPLEIANNLRKNNGTIPGIRAGKPTVDFITRILSKVTLIGALFLAVIAVCPIGISAATGMNIALGGTSILIVVGVSLEVVRSLEAQMMMRHHKGFLE
ncbi:MULTISPECIES: preprotein translocase subunit SecY [Eubacteriales]|uniref:Protein translocase subunit SecY n=1 Tax=Bittarella massiliensis (ex Durand et al. 2017) TaxID=1720313 RepID=A0AAQ1MEN1_9FIRM|nr:MULTISPECIES: preprotein translocase subunit SecY [Eubacteriales]MCB5942002.1 preprotein translocase subunit SecY [bacterium 210820-DFI.6.52]ERI98424.1 preprotein translocase, SecY subunit [Clostridium sp. ATCC 29733]MBO1679853.1 preprotein translocase subunit SecY [Bittarella massiliensis (ex Durand et al. 2017)]MZL70587.1 preprotein translocase subunit SecY [Bittarella massiliensis (ex Durand et al. 2017)]MZL80190.1 preprotein translocase subunit SecY [Bittarella massiliensis (ex Durand e